MNDNETLDLALLALAAILGGWLALAWWEGGRDARRWRR